MILTRILAAIIPVGLAGQISYSGNLNPYNLYRTSDGTEISLPFRLIEGDASYAWGSLEVRTRIAWETRWSVSPRRSQLDIREAYLSWYPAFGELRLGKQIQVWGTVDGNNPTDNLSAYDYYYLFFPGTDRKIGSLSLSVTVYTGDWKVEGVLVPDNEPNRLPFNEPDFPISLPPRPGKGSWGEMSDSVEYGIRASRSFRVGDVSLSYFRGRDRIFGVVGGVFPWAGMRIIPKFGYRRTEVLGTDWVVFMGRLTLRGEGGYFRTANDYDARQFFVKFDTDATYIQYVIQLEVPGPWDINLMGQFIGQEVLSVGGNTLDPLTLNLTPLERENFHPGLGTPFAMFVDRAFLAGADGQLMDGRVEFSLMTLISLEEAGAMVGLTLEYSPVQNWNLEGGAILLRGEEENIFQDLEDFSHIRVGLKYSF
ncbi:MAG: hypothetical protein ACE5HZ_03460 [Fidelibacterota bacterium]